jgi:two-component system LytT family response regulator
MMSDPVRVLLVDDEPLARANLRLALGATTSWQIVAECDSSAAARRVLAEESVDVILLDIRMPRESGVALARWIVDRDRPPLIVFVTAFHGYAIEAFELHALDYLLKPVEDARLAQTVERVESVLAHRAQGSYALAVRGCLDDTPEERPGLRPFLTRFSVRSVGRIDSVQVSDVQWISSAGNYVRLGLPGRTVLHRVTLKQLEGRLDPEQFLRVHRTAIVRLDRLRELMVTGDGTYTLTLVGGMQLPVSERYVDAVRAAMGE